MKNYVEDLTCGEVCEVIAKAWVGDSRNDLDIHGHRFHIGGKNVICVRDSAVTGFQDEEDGKVLWTIDDNGETRSFDAWTAQPSRI